MSPILTGLQFVQESENSTQNLEPFILLGLLVNYNKFEFANPYRLRLDDFVNETAIRKIANSVGAACVLARDKYIAVQDDLPEGWNLSNTLAYVGLGALAPGSRPTTPNLTADETKARFNALYEVSNFTYALTRANSKTVDLDQRQQSFFQHTTSPMQTNCSALASLLYLPSTKVILPQ